MKTEMAVLPAVIFWVTEMTLAQVKLFQLVIQLIQPLIQVVMFVVLSQGQDLRLTILVEPM